MAIGAALSSRLATFRDLDEFMSVEDAYDLLEVLAIDAHNKRTAHKAHEGKR